MTQGNEWLSLMGILNHIHTDLQNLNKGLGDIKDVIEKSNDGKDKT